MLRSMLQFVNRGVFSERERSESHMRLLYKTVAGEDIDEELKRSRTTLSGSQALFDELHDKFGQGIAGSKDIDVNRTASTEALEWLVNRLNGLYLDDQSRWLLEQRF